MKNNILAISTAAPAIPVNPSRPATKATTKKIIAQRNIIPTPLSCCFNIIVSTHYFFVKNDRVKHTLHSVGRGLLRRQQRSLEQLWMKLHSLGYKSSFAAKGSLCHPNLAFCDQNASHLNNVRFIVMLYSLSSLVSRKGFYVFIQNNQDVSCQYVKDWTTRYRSNLPPDWLLDGCNPCNHDLPGRQLYRT